MKELILLSISYFISITSLCQFDIPLNNNGKAKYQEIIETEGLKNELFLKGKDWIFKTYNSGKDVIQYEDKEAGRIFGNGRTQQLIYNNMGIKQNGGYFKYDITIEFKENK